MLFRRPLLLWLALLLAQSLSVLADETRITSDDLFTTACSGIWSKDDVPGNDESFIKVTLDNTSQGKTAMLIYEWNDFDRIGMVNNETGQVQYICDDYAVDNHICDAVDYGTFIVKQDPNDNSSIFTTAFSLKKNETALPEIVLYKVDYTGYYCVAIIHANLEPEEGDRFDAWIEWRLPYGNLPASDYPKLLFYGAFSIAYLAVGIAWGIQTYRFWNDILPVQHFLSATIFFLIVEMAINWGFWEAYNQAGSPSYGLLALVAFMNAGRNSMSFFMLLVVSLGYSVVKPSLGSTMKKCVVLAGTHFFFGVIYSLGVMLLSPESAGFMVLLVIFPLALTMSAFYVWIFSSLTNTIATLEVRKQHVKALMYTRLHRLLVFSVFMVIVIFILNMFAFSGRNQVDWAAKSWKWRWITMDGLLNLLYFVVFLVIVILWRPTSNNQRYGLQQISQDEEEAIALENQLRHAGLDADSTAIFDLGDDDMSDNGDHHSSSKVKLMTVPNHENDQHESSSNRVQSPSSRGNINKKDDPSEDEDEDDDGPDDDERAHLTSNARK
ncbi:integral membrane protein [Lichtheimia corymbifera JMRC:FSU:9682]|uniref:Integral membrane protein n=1 Tax=Lichtheimia corymbifera JMRC:FSU:9682 TaxID=1263082 RepID=A0A068RET2_9FUNG|nr:integral membrane protein [Lichtheimia corymbifera JMRC:FSU:9682]